MSTCAGMGVPMLVFLSAVLLPCVSAGGVYCAKTARARAAALGLYYPGVHAAPHLYEPAQHGIHPSRRLLRPQPYQSNHPAARGTRPRATSSTTRQPDQRSLREQTHSRTWRGPSSPAQRDSAAGRVLPRGRLAIHRKPYFEEVTRVAPPTLAEAPGQPDLVARNPQGRGEPLSFVGDESVPNGGDVSVRRVPLPRRWGHGAYPSSIPGYGLVRAAPVLRSSGSASTATSAVDPGPPNRRLNVKQRFSRAVSLRSECYQSAICWF
ncbi:uncharacterized protein AB9W97_016948 [Spinachia spinachia]